MDRLIPSSLLIWVIVTPANAIFCTFFCISAVSVAESAIVSPYYLEFTLAWWAVLDSNQ